MLFVLREICESKLNGYNETIIDNLTNIKHIAYKYECILNILKGEINVNF
jgi:hypothetical protein